MSMRTRSSVQSTTTPATPATSRPSSAESDVDDPRQDSEHEDGTDAHDREEVQTISWSKEAIAERKAKAEAIEKGKTEFITTILRQIKASDPYTLAFFGSTRERCQATDTAQAPNQTFFAGNKKLCKLMIRLRNRQELTIEKGMDPEWSSWPEVKRKAPAQKDALFKFHQYYFIVRDIMRKAAELEKNRAVERAASFRRKPLPITSGVPFNGRAIDTPPPTSTPSGSVTPSSASINGCGATPTSTHRTDMLAVKLERPALTVNDDNATRTSSPVVSSPPGSQMASDAAWDPRVQTAPSRPAVITTRNAFDISAAVLTPISQRPSAFPATAKAQKRKEPDTSNDTANVKAHAAIRPKSSDTPPSTEHEPAAERAPSPVADIPLERYREQSAAPGPYLERTATAMDMPPPTTPNPFSCHRAEPMRPRDPRRPNATPQWRPPGSATPNPHAGSNDMSRPSFFTHRHQSHAGASTPRPSTPHWSGSATPNRYTSTDERFDIPIGRPFNPRASPYAPFPAPYASTPRWAGHGSATPAMWNAGSATPNPYTRNDGGVTPNPYGPRRKIAPAGAYNEQGSNGRLSDECPLFRSTPSVPGFHQSAEPQAAIHGIPGSTRQVGTGAVAAQSSAHSTNSDQSHGEEKSPGPPMIATIDRRKFIFDAELFRLLSATPAMVKSISADEYNNNKPERTPADSSGAPYRPRWKVERDLYVAVQAVDPGKTWLTMAIKHKWIKQMGSGYHCGTGWTEDLHNPIRDRLDHWRRMRQSAVSKGQLEAFNDTCPYATIIAVLFGKFTSEYTAVQKSEPEPEKVIERASSPATASTQDTLDLGGMEEIRPATPPIPTLSISRDEPPASTPLPKESHNKQMYAPDSLDAASSLITDALGTNDRHHHSTSADEHITESCKYNESSVTTHRDALAPLQHTSNVPLRMLHSGSSHRDEAQKSISISDPIPTSDDLEDGPSTPVSSSPEAVADLGEDLMPTAALSALPDYQSSGLPGRPEPESHWSPPVAPTIPVPVTPQEWLDFSHATVVPKGCIHETIARAYPDVTHLHKHSNFVHDVKVDLLLDAVRAMYMRRDASSRRFPRHSLIFSESTLGTKFGILSGFRAVVRAAYLQRVDENGQEAHLYGHRDRDYFEVYLRLLIKPTPRKLHKTRIQPISLLDYLRLLIKHYIRTA